MTTAPAVVPDLSRAPFSPRLLLVESGAEHEELRSLVRRLDDRALVVRIEPGLGGVWTDYTPEGEVIRFGFPANSRHAYFDILKPSGYRQTAFAIAFERIVFGRRITDVVCASADVVAPVANALATADAIVWCGGSPFAPTDLTAKQPAFEYSSATLSALGTALAQRMAIGSAA